MTEQDWLQATDPRPMLEFLRGKVSVRKLRLFAVACCRQNIHLFNTESIHRAIEVAERYLDFPNAVVHAVPITLSLPPILWRPSDCVAVALQFDAYQAATTSRAWHLPPGFEGAEYAAQASLLRCIVGNPSLPVTLASSWLSWNSGVIRSIAQAIYDERRFSDLPVLADALEEAGCDNAVILGHCRSGGDHFRGCWVLDLCLGKS
jgi:hypothetical protein